jgi:hypothetical protein
MISIEFDTGPAVHFAETPFENVIGLNYGQEKKE